MFLETLAKHCVSKHGHKLQDQCFIFPNRRSGLFFKRYLLKYSEGTSWAPEILTISEFMQKLSGLKLSDPLDLLIWIYKAYCSSVELAEPFDTFYSWGEMMISDFDNLDKYLVDADEIFKNIDDLKEIDSQFGALEEEQIAFIRKFWKSFQVEEQSAEKEVFLTTWRMLPRIYKAFQKILDAEVQGYEGRIYRKVSERDFVELNEKLDKEHYSFAGFNALSKSERSLFRKLQNRGLASFYWDYDKRYIADHSMEAGRFLRENVAEFPSDEDLDIFSSLSDSKEIRIFDLPSDILQAKTTYELLNDRTEPIKDASDTAIIACDENLLMPILFSLPDQVKQVNITMGYPFQNTPLNSFIESLLRMIRNARKTTNSARYYHKDVLSVLNHQYFSIIGNNSNTELISRITDLNMVYVDAAVFTGELELLIFKDVREVHELHAYLDAILQYLLSIFIAKEDQQFADLEKEYILLTISRLNKVSRRLKELPAMELQTYMRLIRKMMSGYRVPFEGEPLAGLQIMGILETRLLDFKHVIMLSVNEEIMPKSSAGHSFIPHSIRYAYKLPTREDMDAIYAYYFYRIIQRADKVDLMFNSASEGVKSGEMSRYLYQMKYDMGAKMIQPVLQVPSSEVKEIIVEKTDAVMETLNKYVKGEDKKDFLSPSGLNTYIECSLKYYFRYIVGVSEEDELLEELDAIGFGIILHDTIYELYKGILEKKSIIEADDLKRLSASPGTEELLRRMFLRTFYKSEKEREIEGRNLIILAILKKYLLRIIQTDLEHAPFEIIDLEETYRQVRNISISGTQLEVVVGGKIDRIDAIEEGIVRIIDYKSGNPGMRFESIESLFNGLHKGRSKEGFQACLYSLLYLNSHEGQTVQPGLYVLRQMFGTEFSPLFRIGQSMKSQPMIAFNPFSKDFETHLDKLLEELFNVEVPFVQTSNTEHCKYCEFNRMCQRK